MRAYSAVLVSFMSCALIAHGANHEGLVSNSGSSSGGGMMMESHSHSEDAMSGSAGGQDGQYPPSGYQPSKPQGYGGYKSQGYGYKPSGYGYKSQGYSYKPPSYGYTPSYGTFFLIA